MGTRDKQLLDSLFSTYCVSQANSLEWQLKQVVLACDFDPVLGLSKGAGPIPVVFYQPERRQIEFLQGYLISPWDLTSKLGYLLRELHNKAEKENKDAHYNNWTYRNKQIWFKIDDVLNQK